MSQQKPSVLQDVQVQVKKTYMLTLTGPQLIAMLNSDTSVKIPSDARVEFDVPGGGDYSSTTLDVDARSPVTIRWTTREHEIRAWLSTTCDS